MLQVYHKWIYAYMDTRMKYVKKRQTYSYIKFMWLLCYHLSNYRVVSVTTVRIARVVDMNNEHTECPTRYQTQHFFNNSNTKEDSATEFEQEYVLSFTFLTQ
jgi:hypothetical protein